MLRRGNIRPSGCNLNKLTTGSGEKLDMHTQTVQTVYETYAAQRSEHYQPVLLYYGKKTP